jgi:hypothetical protein
MKAIDALYEEMEEKGVDPAASDDSQAMVRDAHTGVEAARWALDQALALYNSGATVEREDLFGPGESAA